MKQIHLFNISFNCVLTFGKTVYKSKQTTKKPPKQILFQQDVNQTFLKAQHRKIIDLLIQTGSIFTPGLLDVFSYCRMIPNFFPFFYCMYL